MTDPDETPSYRDIARWSSSIADYWKYLAAELDIPGEKIRNISKNLPLYPTLEDQALQMLEEWRDTGNATYRKMAEALRTLGKGNLANTICPTQAAEGRNVHPDSSPSTVAPHVSNGSRKRKRKDEGTATGHQDVSKSKPPARPPFKNVKASSSANAQEQEGIPNEKLTKQELLKIAKGVNAQYTELGVHLDVEMNEINNIAGDPAIRTPSDKAFNILLKWAGSTKCPTRSELARALVAMERLDLEAMLYK